MDKGKIVNLHYGLQMLLLQDALLYKVRCHRTLVQHHWKQWALTLHRKSLCPNPCNQIQINIQIPGFFQRHHVFYGSSLLVPLQLWHRIFTCTDCPKHCTDPTGRSWAVLPWMRVKPWLLFCYHFCLCVTWVVVSLLPGCSWRGNLTSTHPLKALLTVRKRFVSTISRFSSRNFLQAGQSPWKWFLSQTEQVGKNLQEIKAEPWSCICLGRLWNTWTFFNGSAAGY